METIAITAAGRSEGFPMPMTTFEGNIFKKFREIEFHDIFSSIYTD